MNSTPCVSRPHAPQASRYPHVSQTGRRAPSTLLDVAHTAHGTIHGCVWDCLHTKRGLPKFRVSLETSQVFGSEAATPVGLETLQVFGGEAATPVGLETSQEGVGATFLIFVSAGAPRTYIFFGRGEGGEALQITKTHSPPFPLFSFSHFPLFPSFPIFLFSTVFSLFPFFHFFLFHLFFPFSSLPAPPSPLSLPSLPLFSPSPFSFSSLFLLCPIVSNFSLCPMFRSFFFLPFFHVSPPPFFPSSLLPFFPSSLPPLLCLLSFFPFSFFASSLFPFFASSFFPFTLELATFHLRNLELKPLTP